MDIWIPLIAGLVGALIGAGASVTAVFVQAKAQASRDRIKLAVEAAMQEQRAHISEVRPGEVIPPLSPYVYFMLGFWNS